MIRTDQAIVVVEALRRIVGRLRRRPHAGVVHEHVDAAEPVQRERDDALHVGSIGDIRFERDRFGFERLRQVGDLFAQVTNDESRTFTRKRGRERPAETDRGAGHEGDFAAQ